MEISKSKLKIKERLLKIYKEEYKKLTELIKNYSLGDYNYYYYKRSALNCSKQIIEVEYDIKLINQEIKLSGNSNRKYKKTAIEYRDNSL